MEKARALMSHAKVPQHYDKVFKDECAFTFDTPFSENGLCVNLKTWLGVAMDMVDADVSRNGGQGGLYLVQKFRRVPKEAKEDGEPSKLAIGVPGGFLEEKWEIVKDHSLLVVDASGTKATVPLPNPDVPMIITNACDAVIAHQGASSMESTSQWEQDQTITDSKYAKDLIQLPPTKKISPNPRDWVCGISGDTQNLWLNLSDGFIGGGRRFFDGTGGSNGALDHFKEEQAKGNFYPLVVKLGTITPHGADVYSYAPDEDDSCKDPLLAEHLAHWGIDVMKMEKTDKTLAEMEVDLNMSYDWSRICESGDKPLVRLRGPGLVGLKNLGNSCYMNSTVQLLAGVPEMKARYFDEDCQIRRKAQSDVPTDLVGQMAKLVNGLLGERYAPPWREGDDEDDPRFIVAPQMFRSLVGKGHPEFSSGRQQDAAEFFQYFLDTLARAERTTLGSRLAAGEPTPGLFEFAVEERLQESSGEGRVKYSRLRQNMLGLPVKLDDAENLAEVMAFKNAQEAEEKEAKKPKTGADVEEPKPIIRLPACLARLAAPEEGISFRGTTVTKTSRIATMPRYLVVQLQRYFLDEKWMPSKLDCKVPMPETLSLEHLRGKGLQGEETELPEVADEQTQTAPAPGSGAPLPDETIVAQLLSMGISENAARRSCLAVQNANAEAATAWYFDHMEDPDINNPPEASAAAAAPGGAPAADPESVAMLVSMGFSEAHVAGALRACSGSVERAADWLFSHSDDLDGAIAALDGGGAAGGPGAEAPGRPGAEAYDDGPGEYTLLGFISHVGKHTSHGHYVCHMKRDPSGGWVIFDDQKVAKSESPPTDLGYIYLYRRNDVAA